MTTADRFLIRALVTAKRNGASLVTFRVDVFGSGSCNLRAAPDTIALDETGVSFPNDRGETVYLPYERVAYITVT